MKIKPFELERFFAKHEFSARYLMSSSDCEALELSSLLKMADPALSRSWEDLRLGYTETRGHPALRQAVADLYPGCEERHVLVAAPEECIYLLMNSVLSRGDHVVATFPGYQSLYEIARSLGCKVSFWGPNEQRGWEFNVTQLAALVESDTKLIVVNFPHNPTGSLPSREGFEAIVDVARNQGIHILCDEMYRFLERDDEFRLPGACTRYDNAVSLGGLSKAFGLPGLRIGWLATRDIGLLDKASHLRDYTTICNAAPSEILGLIALRNREAITSQHRARIARNLDAFDRYLVERGDDFRWNRPRAGSVGFLRIEGVEDTFSLCETLIQEVGVMLVPSRLFDYGDSHVRIGFGREDFPVVLRHFADHWQLR